ncbi:MAG TPA: gluconate 2-dehydrogenase subunit 3 family protein [Rhodanobacteraceae bacterium]|nr:gluconate 2-dehydrogenase subunit 3 family protein [Rhodanobacteraceae bacterium]
MHDRSHDRYPGYDVLRKRDTPSWNDATRSVIDARLAIPDTAQFLGVEEWQTLKAICDRIVPQPGDRPPVPIAALVDHKLAKDHRDGYRQASIPPLREAWRRGLAALDAESQARHRRRFHALTVGFQDDLLKAMQDGKLDGPAWQGMSSGTFFSERITHDILAAYYSHPTSWNELGFGGPASPRGYVRMYFDRRDPWEAVEAKPGHEEEARKANEDVGTPKPGSLRRMTDDGRG